MPDQNLALFDFDGTITFRDTFTPFLYFASSRTHIVRQSLRLAPAILGYKLGLVPATKMRALAAGAAFRGRSEAELRELGATYAERVLPGVIRPQALERIHWHKQRGDRIVVVSASLAVYVRPWAQPLELDVIATELSTKDGLLTGGYEGGDCAGPEKARRVEARYAPSGYATVFAYGDTSEDDALLALADEPYFRWQPAAHTARATNTFDKKAGSLLSRRNPAPASSPSRLSRK
jgi:phosphatidylglycerophosphatase C